MTTPNFPNSPEPAHEGGYDTGSTGTKEQAKQTASTAADESKHVAGVAQGEIKKVASEAKTQVSGLLNEATSQLDQQSRQQQGRLAETVRTFSDDLEDMSSKSESNGVAAGLAREVADRARNLAVQLDSREPRDLLDEVRSYARRKPGTFLLGSLAAGVVAGRLTRGAKATQDGESQYDYRGAPGMNPPTRPVSGGLVAPVSASEGEPYEVGGTATGDPLAGTGTPGASPAYPTSPGVTGQPEPSTPWTDVSDPDGGRI